MGTRIDGDNMTIPGQVTVGTRATSSQHVVRRMDVNRWRVWVNGLDVNGAAPLDLAVLEVPSDKWVPTRIVALNASGDVSLATLGLYTEAAAGGVEIVAPAALADMDAAGKMQVLTIAAIATPLTAETLYPRLTVAAGAAATIDLLLEFEDLSDI